MKNKIGAMILAAAFGLVACSGKKYEFKPGEFAAKNETKETALSADVVWLKSKGNAVDMLLTVKNQYPHPVYVKKGSIKLYFNDAMGSRMKNEFHEEMLAGTAETALLIYRFDPAKPMKGKVKLVIEPSEDKEMKKVLPPITLEREVQ